MKRTDTKSHCPINFALECIGDPWSLLIVRDIVYFGKKTFGEFLDSEERIATNVLASRLAQLEQRDILAKKQHAADKRKEIYELTEKGLALIPVLLELADWSAAFDCQTETPASWIDTVNSQKAEMVQLICETVRHGGAVFGGPNCLASQLKPLPQQKLAANAASHLKYPPDLPAT